MNVIIIGGSQGEPTQAERDYYQQYVDFFKQSAKRASDDTVISSAMMDDLLIQVGDGSIAIYDTFNGRDLSEYDAIFFRGDKFRTHMDVIATINEYATRHNISVVNDYGNVRDSSKLLQATHFEMIGVPVARTLNVNSALLRHIDRVEGLTFPCIMKAKHGSHGHDNYVVNSLKDVRDILSKDPNKAFVLQRFVPNDGDYRILIIGDEVFVIGRTAQEGSHLNNTSQGGTAIEAPIETLPASVLAQARAIASHFKMSIAGVDAIRDKTTGEFFFLEVNAQPQLMSGAFVDKKSELLATLLNKIGSKK